MDSVSLLWCSKRSHDGVLVVLVAVEVEQVGTIAARLDLKPPAAPPSPTTDTLSLFNYSESLCCVVTAEEETIVGF
jgi:hypothetical protein